jgi:hypothetical protein
MLMLKNINIAHKLDRLETSRSHLSFTGQTEAF